MSDVDLNHFNLSHVSAQDANFEPVVERDWWNKHVVYSKFNRQGIDIFTASFVHPTPKANIVFVTGWSETFLKYPELIKWLYESGYSVYTYDHQSQGLSGRWLPEHQYTWIRTFDDYIDDFVYYVTLLERLDTKNLPFHCIAHSMGGLIAATAMVKNPLLVNKLVLSAPMLRNKCGMKCFEYKAPLPQPLAYWITSIVCYLGLGKIPTMGMFKEDPDDHITLKLTTDMEQLNNWEKLRQKYPRIISSCVTNDWLLQSLIAQRNFAAQYASMKSSCLLFKAHEDIFVYNHAMDIFTKTAPNTKSFCVPDSYHELLLEKKVYRQAVTSMIVDFFDSSDNTVENVYPQGLIFEGDNEVQVFSLPQMLYRASGVLLALSLGVAGVSLMVNGKKK